MKMNENELKARLAEAEALFSRYRWEEAIASFEAILAARPDHAAASQGLADALEQQKTDGELADTIGGARQALAAYQFSDALAALNRAQTRGAMRHILKYHGEIDGLRSQAQEGRELKRMADQALERAEGLAGQRKFDASLQALDNALQELSARGWESLGGKLRAARERLWAERDVDERVQFALAAFERQDYQTATELAEALHRQFPKRDDIARLHERSHAAWGRMQERLKGVQERLAEERLDDAVAMLAHLRDEYPHNPDWQALWLKAHMDHGRNQVSAGRRAIANHRFDTAAEIFSAAVAAFNEALSVFDRHPTAALERMETEALYAAASFAAQGARDSAAGRWEASRREWDAARTRLTQAREVRQRDFGEMVAVVDTMLAEVSDTVADLERARLLLTEGRQALEARDAGRARECFRNALNHAEKSPDGLREQAAAGLREAERAQREAKKLVAQAGHAGDVAERLALLRTAYERWTAAPGLVSQLVDTLLAAANDALAAGDESLAAGYCEQIRAIPNAPDALQAQAERMAAGIAARRDLQTALAEATRLLAELERSPAPTAAGYGEVVALLARADDRAADAFDETPSLAAQVAGMLRQARDRHDRLAAVEPQIARAEALREAGDWAGAARELGQAVEQLGDLPAREIVKRARRYSAITGEIEAGLARAEESLARAEAAYAVARDGDLNRVAWTELQAALDGAQAELGDAPAHPVPSAWEELRARVEEFAERVALLRQVAERVRTGQAVDALPLLQGDSTDPVLAAVRTVLRRASVGAAHERAAVCLAAAEAHFAAGELPAAAASLSEATAYSAAAPELSRRVRWLETRLSLVTRAQELTVEGRRHRAEDRPDEARRACRLALELLAAAEGNLPADARQALHALLLLEEELWEEDARAEGEALFHALLAGADSPLLKVCLPGPLRIWWRLTCRSADIAYIEAQMALGRDLPAFVRVERAVTAHPMDAHVRELYARTQPQMAERAAAVIRRRLERTTRLRGEGAYAAGLAELARIERELPASFAGSAGDIGHDPEVAPLLESAADLRLDLAGLHALAERLQPLAEQARTAGLAGQHEAAQAALAQAELVDPTRRAAALWRELSALAGVLMAQVRAATRSRLAAMVTETDIRLDLNPAQDELRELIVQLARAGLSAPVLDGPEDEPLRKQLAHVKTRAAAAWARLGQGAELFPSAHEALHLPDPPQAVVPVVPRNGHPVEGSAGPSNGQAQPEAARPLDGLPSNGHGRLPVPPLAPPEPPAGRRNGGEALPKTTTEPVAEAALPKRKNGKPPAAPVEAPGPATEPDLPPMPFDYDDWGSNVTPVVPEEGDAG